MDLKSLAVLVLDDNRHMRAYMTEILRNLGIQRIYHADSAKAALNIARQGVADIAFADIELGGDDGLSFVRNVRADSQSRIAGLPIVMVSANASGARVLEAREAGVNGFIAKPISVTAVATRLADALRDRRLAVTGDTSLRL